MLSSSLTRSDAIRELHEHGIEANGIYFIAAIPLIQMMWADGKIQPAEVTLLVEFLEKHVRAVNRFAGLMFVTYEDALAFVRPFLSTQPSAELLRLVTALVPVLDLSTSDPELNEQRRRTILDYCRDIAAAAVNGYAYGAHDRFNPAEKSCMMSIVYALA